MKKRIWEAIAVNCFSFTCLIVVNAVLSLYETINILNPVVALQFFVCTSTIALLQLLVGVFLSGYTEKNLFVDIFVNLLCVNLAVFVLGGLLFQWFSFGKASHIVLVLILNFSIFAIVYALLAAKAAMDASQINKAIQRAKKQREIQHEQ